MKTPWTISDLTNTHYLGCIEFQDNKGEWHSFSVMQSPERIIFGDICNTGFLESGYNIPEEGQSLEETMGEMLADLETFYNDGPQYVSRIVVNDRM